MMMNWGSGGRLDMEEVAKKDMLIEMMFCALVSLCFTMKIPIFNVKAHCQADGILFREFFAAGAAILRTNQTNECRIGILKHVNEKLKVKEVFHIV